ncbi:hypothetical protein OQA88_9939 [Cercophora sp. LCS_1]
MTLYTPAPPLRPFSQDKPTVLVCWWVAALCSVVIAFRLAGRWVRVEKFFVEDKIAAVFLIPLFLRTALIHVVLLYGTNNVSLADAALEFTDDELRRRKIGSGLVLWILKFVNLEFFGRLVTGKRYTQTLWAVRMTLVATFVAVIIADLAECQPFTHYWQVLPDPGGQCRQGYAQLITMAVCSGVTDLLLVVFPVPVIASSQLTLGRKIVLMMLFCLAVFNVVVSAYRVPIVVKEDGYQGTRTTWASAEVLVATFVANVLALGSFIRGTGVKKNRFRYEPGSSTEMSGHRAHDTLERGRGKVQMGVGVKRATSGETTDSGEVRVTSRGMGMGTGMGLERTQSRDSLIPRGHSVKGSLDAGGVIKTMTVTVEVAEGEGDGTTGTPIGLPLPAHRSKSASSRGRERGSTIMLQNMEGLPRGDSPKGV